MKTVSRPSAELAAAQERLVALENVCGEAYQLAGACGASVKALDNLSAASDGRPIPHKTFLPISPDELKEVKEIKDSLVVALRLLRRVTWRPKIHLSECNCPDCKAVDAFLEAAEKLIPAPESSPSPRPSETK
jgi:hypothetical protein